MKSPSNSSKRNARVENDIRHTIKNHLTAIKTLLQLAQLKLASGDNDETEKILVRSLGRLEQLINDYRQSDNQTPERNESKV